MAKYRRGSGMGGIFNAGLKLAGVVFVLKTLADVSGVSGKIGTAAQSAGIKIYG